METSYVAPLHFEERLLLIPQRLPVNPLRAYTYKFSAPWTPAANTWYHVAVERNGNTPKIAIDGVFLTVTESTAIAGKTASNLNGSFAIGAYNATNALNGWIDEFRYSKGIVRWTENFTPPSEAYYGTYVTPTQTPLPTAEWVEKQYAYAGTQIAGTPYPQPHAVTLLTDAETSTTLGSYEYDKNGNMTCRAEYSEEDEQVVTYKQEYNTENRISAIYRVTGDCDTGSIAEAWYFAYDGDGTRTVTVHDKKDNTALEVSAYYFGGAYEATGTGAFEDNALTGLAVTAAKKYYSFNGQIVAVNSCEADCSLETPTWTLSYLLTDHLGSVVAVMTPNQNNGWDTIQQRYLPFGGQRTDVGNITQTDYSYTGQRTLDEGMGGIMDYKARFYSSYINHFLQPDSLIPDPSNPQAWNRYSYVKNRPIGSLDPSGHDDVPFSWTLSTDMFVNAIDSVGNVFGNENLSDSIAPLYDTASTIADGSAWALLAISTGIEAAGACIGATSGVVLSPGTAPITGPAGAYLGYKVTDIGTQPFQNLAAILGGLSTAYTTASDVLTGDTSLTMKFSMDSSGHFGYLDINGTLGQDTYTSGAITLAGVFAGRNAPSALMFQTVAVANDLGFIRNPAVGNKMMDLGEHIGRKGFRGEGELLNILGYAQGSMSTKISQRLPRNISFSKRIQMK